MDGAKSIDHMVLSKCLMYSDTEGVEIIVGSPSVLHAIELIEERIA